MKLDELRSVLREPPTEPLRVSLDAILAEGRRRRARRRVGVTLTAAGATAAVVAGVPAVLSARSGESTRPAQVPVAGPSSGAASAPGDPTSTSGPASPANTADRRVGALIQTGELVSGGERVFWFERYSNQQLPKNHLLLAAGRRNPATGKVRMDVANNEFDGPDLAPGFHAVWFGEQAVGAEWIVLGYYVGPAERITLTVGRRQGSARTARWSGDRNVQVFWFVSDTGAPRPDVLGQHGSLAAYDASGRPLPAGHSAIGVG